MNLRKAAEEVIEAWGWDISEPRNKMLRERIKTLRQALGEPDEVLVEREACAKVCENMERNGAWITKAEAAAAIRERGEK